MQTVVLNWYQLGLLAVVFLLVGGLGVVIGLLQGRGVVARPQQPDADLDIELLRDDVAILRRELHGLRNRLDELPASQPSAPVMTEAETAYAQAMRLAQQGMDSSAVAAECGISRGEAELIVALYRAAKRS